MSNHVKAEIVSIIRSDFDQTPKTWEGAGWYDNAEEVADDIIALFQRPAPAAVEDLVARLVKMAGFLLSLHGVEDSPTPTALREAATALCTLAADKARIEAERDTLRRSHASAEQALLDVVAERDTAKGTAELATDVLKKEWVSHRDTLDRALAAEARASALEGALKQIASQKTVNELCAEFGKEYETDWEGSYDQCIATARATLSPAKETP